MFFHKRGDFDSHAYGRNREAKRALTAEGRAHGTIVYCGKDPVAWCQFGPKEELPRIDGKRGYKPTDANPWRVTCLFVAPGHRKSGLAGFAVKESLKAMRKMKVKVVESYPVEGRRSASLLWMGTPHLFEGLGFTRAGPLGKGSWIYSLDLSKA
jgi:predicted GNAT family acetyltransferase